MGDSFRRDFSTLGEVRSIIPDKVKVMALTATATKETRTCIIKSLNMQKPTIVSIPPVKDNIMYAIAKKSTTDHAFGPLAKNWLRNEQKWEE